MVKESNAPTNDSRWYLPILSLSIKLAFPLNGFHYKTRKVVADHCAQESQDIGSYTVQTSRACRFGVDGFSLTGFTTWSREQGRSNIQHLQSASHKQNCKLLI
jgi:hypothetical protein